MKIPKCGTKFLKAKAIADRHRKFELVGETCKDVFFGLFAKQPVYIYHNPEVETIRHPDRMAVSYRVHCPGSVKCDFFEEVL